MTNKIAILCPILFNDPPNTSFKETSFYKNTLYSFMQTYDKNQQYMFFIGIQNKENTFNNIETQNELKRFVSVMINVNLEFFYITDKNLSLVSMWNFLSNISCKNNYEYYINITDNNLFKTNGWIQTSLLRLKQNNNIGFVYFMDNKKKGTTVMVHQRHLNALKYFFHDNLVFDYWIQWFENIYPKKYSVYLNNFNIINKQPFLKKQLAQSYVNLMIKNDTIKLKRIFNYIYQE